MVFEGSIAVERGADQGPRRSPASSCPHIRQRSEGEVRPDGRRSQPALWPDSTSLHRQTPTGLTNLHFGFSSRRELVVSQQCMMGTKAGLTSALS